MAKLVVRVVPKASRPGVEAYGNTVRVKVTSAPQHGKANKEVCEVIADWLGVPKSRIRIVSGHTSRTKVIEIAGMEQSRIEQIVKAMREG